MDEIILMTGILLYTIGILLMSRSKKNISNDAIIDYEKNIRPNFFNFFTCINSNASNNGIVTF